MLRRTLVPFQLLLLLSLSFPVWAQVAQYLAIEGEGTASIVLDVPTKTAYITDGGKSGTAGLQGARIEGKPALLYLRSEGIERLVITCSHPHADHMGGLRSAIQDPAIRTFKELVFVDNEYDALSGGKSLYKLYTQTWGSRGLGSGPKVSHSSAKMRDAFTGLARQGAQVRASNIVYDPAEVLGSSKDVHGHAIISQYEIAGDGKAIRVVDFDDASTGLITTLAQKESLRFDVLVIPHHGSAKNNLGPVLARRSQFGVRDVIITVNANNRYDHPSPEVLERLLRDFGSDHVFITGSRIGESVQVTSNGVRVVGGSLRHRERLAAFIEARLNHHAGVTRHIFQKAYAAAGGQVKLSAGLNGAPSEQMLDAFEAQRLISDREMVRLRGSMKAMDHLKTSLELVKPNSRRGEQLLAAAGRGLDPFTLPDPPRRPTPNPGLEGVKRYRELYNSQNSEGDAPFSPSAGGGPSGPQRPGGPGAVSRETAGRTTSFRRMLSARVPRFGGVILGNEAEYSGIKPVTLEIIPLSADADGEVHALPILRVILADGASTDYADVTPTELWAAYHFVSDHSVELEGETWTLPGNAGGLVGIAENHDSYWTFAIHPAIRGTFLARDAMRLDLLISALRSEAVAVPASMRAIAWQDLRFHTYQWYDAPAVISLREGQIEVGPSGPGPKDCLMRVRLVDLAAPAWYDEEDAEPSVEAEVIRRAIARAGDETDEAAAKQLVEDVAREVTGELESSFKDDLTLNPKLGAVCRGFDALQSIDRLARVVAVLNWYMSASGRELPPLPDFVEPLHYNVPASWPLSAVLATEAGEGVPAFTKAAERPLQPPPRLLEEEKVLENLEEPLEKPEDGFRFNLSVLLPALGVVLLGGLWIRRRLR